MLCRRAESDRDCNCIGDFGPGRSSRTELGTGMPKHIYLLVAMSPSLYLVVYRIRDRATESLGSGDVLSALFFRGLLQSECGG